MWALGESRLEKVGSGELDVTVQFVSSPDYVTFFAESYCITCFFGGGVHTASITFEGVGSYFSLGP